MAFMFRDLTADEVECRVNTIKGNGLTILLYKDARCDQNILDETVGPTNWQRHHSRDNANCVVSIWDADKKQWIEKEDVGVESRPDGSGNEKKGIASDSFKRACFNWGIGRELYTAPSFIWIPAEKTDIQSNGNNKWTCHDDFEVVHMEVEDGRIKSLAIAGKKGTVYEYGMKRKNNSFGKPFDPGLAKKGIDYEPADTDLLKNLHQKYMDKVASELIRTGFGEKAIMKKYGVKSIGDMNFTQYNQFVTGMKDVKDKKPEVVNIGGKAS